MERFGNKKIFWNDEKNELLKKTRNVNFFEILQAIEQKNFYIIMKHPNKEKYPNQYILQIEVNDYIHTVPFVEDEEKIFFKTIFKNRKINKQLKNNK